MTEQEWDKKLKINTMGRDDTHADEYHHPYEPTPYGVLKRLAESGYIARENVLVDYGCGKGRVGFFLNATIGCKAIGLEYDEKIYNYALSNLESYNTGKNISFLCQNAEDYVVTDGDCFYFFNPFRVEILRSVINRLMDSYYENPRRIRLFFYYPDDEYVSYLLVEEADRIDFVDEIDFGDLFEGNDKRERILVFEVDG